MLITVRLKTRVTTQQKVEKFENLFRNAAHERGLPVVDTNHEPINIQGLKDQENRELNGILTPSPSVLLQIQVDYCKKALDETKNMMNREDNGSQEEFELNERSLGLEEALNVTLEERQLEEVREQQEYDISRLEKIKEWFKEN